MSMSSEDRSAAGARRIRRQRLAKSLGQLTPQATPTIGVGRHTSRHYCEDCGRKLRVCQCDRGERHEV